MKKFLFLTALFAFAAIPFTGCTTKTHVPENAQSPISDWNSVMGTLTIYYPQSSMEEVFNATKKGLDEIKYFRTGETPAKDRISVFARAVGDVKVTVDIAVRVDVKTKAKTTYAVISYGTWGNLAESQKIAGVISKNLH